MYRTYDHQECLTVENLRKTLINMKINANDLEKNAVIQGKIANSTVDYDALDHNSIGSVLAVEDSTPSIVQTENYGERKMYSVESPDKRYVSYTEHELEIGEHTISIEPMFLETISSYFVVPHIQNGSEVTVLERLSSSFKVFVQGHATEVVFEIIGKCKGYEDTYMEEVEQTQLPDEN